MLLSNDLSSHSLTCNNIPKF